MDRQKYIIRAEVRDSNGKLITNSRGNKVTHLQLSDVDILPEHLEKELGHSFSDLKALMPDKQVCVEASVYNSIGGSYMSMARFDEQGYVKYS
jgi:hypothetical protein